MELSAEDNERIMNEDFSPELYEFLKSNVNSLRTIFESYRGTDADLGACEYGFELRTNGSGVWGFRSFSADTTVWRSEVRATSLEELVKTYNEMPEELGGEGWMYEEWPSLEYEKEYDGD